MIAATRSRSNVAPSNSHVRHLAPRPLETIRCVARGQRPEPGGSRSRDLRLPGLEWRWEYNNDSHLAGLDSTLLRPRYDVWSRLPAARTSGAIPRRLFTGRNGLVSRRDRPGCAGLVFAAEHHQCRSCFSPAFAGPSRTE